MIKKWFISNKKALISFLFSSITFIIIAGISVSVLTNNLEDLAYYAETGIVTDAMKTFGLLALLLVTVMTAWLIIMLYLLFRIIFPNASTVKNAFFISELNQLKNIPTEIKKGMNKV